jgi:DNA-binding transcriptional LysR family regulator
MPRLLPSITALQCFEAAARRLSMTQAATELHLTQSAISKQIAGLEAQLGRTLFTRNHQRLQLTATGERYLAEVKKILTHVESSARAIVAYGDTTSVLTIATIPTLGARWLLPALKGFGQRHPHIHLDLRDDLRAQDGPSWQADVVFNYNDSAQPQHNQLRLFGEQLIAVGTPRYSRPRDLHAWLDTEVLLHCSERPDAWRDWLAGQGVDTPRSHSWPTLGPFRHVCERGTGGLRRGAGAR